MKKLYRSNTDKIIWGVCGGLGEYFQIDSIIFRILIIILFFAGGLGLFFYALLAIMMPLSPKTKEEEEKDSKPNKNFRYALGIFISLLGFNIILSHTFGFDLFSFINWKIILSLFLILIGVKIIFENEK